MKPLASRLLLTALFPALLPAIFPALAAAQATATAPTPAPGTGYLAGILVNDARDDLRNPNLPPAAAAVQATVLLQFANQLDPADLRTLHLLAQTAQAADKTDVRRAALRQIIAADPGDLVAQVQYIDLLADDSQKAEDRVAFYQRMLPQTDLDAQVRSEVALRLARLAEARGDTVHCREYLAQAVKLNDVNIGALRDLVRLAAAEAGPDAFTNHLRALAALLNANPYQPDAWLQVARLAQRAGVHDRAAEFLDTAADQFRLDGTPPAGDLYLDLAIQFALAGQTAKARTLAANLANLPDAPLAALLVDELLAQQNLPTSASPVASQPASHVADIRRRLAELAKDRKNAAALADAAGADLTILATPGPDTPGWIDAYAKLVAPEDPTLIRLQGWLFFRQNQFAEAQLLLEESTDPLAKLCLARILLATNHAALASRILQELWNANPSGLLALQVALTANHPDLKTLGLALADSTTAKQVRPLIARLTPALANLHRQPRDVQLISLNLRQPAVGPGEPAFMQVRMTNTLDRAVPVGPEGLVKSTIGLAAATRGTITAPVGLYAIEDLQRVFRLEPRQIMETTIRVDQGKLADLFDQNLNGILISSITLVTAPRVLSPAEFTVGLGGQAVVAGEFQRGALPTIAPADRRRLAEELTTLTGERQLIRIEAAALLSTLKDDEDGRLGVALTAIPGSKDPLVRAAFVHALPTGEPAVLANALPPLATDPDPLVRLLWARRQGRIAENGEQRGAAAVATLEKMAAVEKDERVKDWLAVTLPLAKSAATRPK
jgi:hypothetical protein